MKFGALTPCRNCGATPSSSEEIDLSIALTDHYFEATELEQFGLKIKQGVQFILADENGKPCTSVDEQDPEPQS